MRRASIRVVICLLLTSLAAAQQKKIKVIADQDSAGPQGTNFLSLLMLLRAPQIDLLGITTVSGDQWMEPATVFALWGEEQAGRSDVPVIKGAEMPLLNTPREQELRESLYGSYVGWHGSFNPDAPNPKQTWAPPGGYPRLKPKPGRAADFIADTIRANPGEVVLYCAGPLTNIALAVRMDPEIVQLTRAIYIMGGSSSGGPELNWWWDPEAAAIVLRAPWKQIVVSPFEAGEQVWSSEKLMRRVVQAGGPLANHVKSELPRLQAAGGNHALVHDVGRVDGRVHHRSQRDQEIGNHVPGRGYRTRPQVRAHRGLEKARGRAGIFSCLQQPPGPGS